ncbi:haloacetate dehalogenase [Aquisalimonas asiatica]|uniref:Haloacetate dehalogenase n=2 Tax=Aquisalimonas asiatica TaxID=406100 RepID=A0A1H8SN01_9GAMM|nr:haloacetate dehalogenase [Aquisalimonas asiatica]
MFFPGFDTHRVTANGTDIHLRKGGDGPPLLLLHGYPQTHVMWHPIAERLAERYTVICPDLRGYGDSAKPASDDRHAPYSKRAMAADQVAVMAHFGFDRFQVVGHDRGARVGHRMALDHPDRVARLAVLDIVPTRDVFRTADQALATAYYHWFFLIQSDGLPEHMIGLDPEYYLRDKLRRWSRVPDAFDERAVQEYLRCFRAPATIHATCEDYRAAATIDLEHDEADLHLRVQCPLLALWGELGFVGQMYDVPAVWRERADHVTGDGLACGHFLVEEAPEETLAALQAFLD